MRHPLRSTIFSLSSFVAAIGALVTSLWLGLDRPFWAIMTVYITSQPHTGAVRSKAAFRLLGTLVGVVAAIVIIPNLAHVPMLCALAMSAWLGVCLSLALLDRSPRSYVFMLAGYTAAIVGFPSVNQPELIFEVAVIRAQEIAIGVAWAAVMHTVFFPTSVGSILASRVEAIVRHCGHYLAAATDAATTYDVGRIAADLSDVHHLATHVPYDTEASGHLRQLLAGVQEALLDALPYVSAIEDRLRALEELGGTSAKTRVYLSAVAAWATSASWSDVPPHPPASNEAPEPWRRLLEQNLVERLTRAVGALARARELAHAIRSDSRGAPTAVVRPRAMHRDYGMAALGGGTAMLTLLALCAYWIATSWSEGSSAMVFAAMAVSFYASHDDPTPAQLRFLMWGLLAVALDALYLFVFLPRVHTAEMLALVLLPPLYLIGVALADTRRAQGAMAFMLVFVGGLALQPTFSVDFATFANINVAVLVGLGGAFAGSRVLRVAAAGAMVRRLLRATWVDLAELADAPTRRDARHRLSRIIDRLGLIAPRVEASGGRRIPELELRDLRVGISVAELASSMSAPEPASQARDILSDVGHHYRELIDGKRVSPTPRLLMRIDEALRALEVAAAPPSRDMGLIALTSLRRNFFPDALAFTHRPAVTQ